MLIITGVPTLCSSSAVHCGLHCWIERQSWNNAPQSASARLIKIDQDYCDPHLPRLLMNSWDWGGVSQPVASTYVTCVQSCTQSHVARHVQLCLFIFWISDLHARMTISCPSRAWQCQKLLCACVLARWPSGAHTCQNPEIRLFQSMIPSHVRQCQKPACTCMQVSWLSGAHVR